MAVSYQGTLTVPSLIVDVASPIDVRTVVDSISDLTNGSIQKLYTGIVVNIKGTGDLYILTKHPRMANQLTSWVKVGGEDVVIDPADYLSFYEEKLGAKVVDTFDELLDPAFDSFEGMFGVVKLGSSDSDDESGLYVLTRTPNTTASNWYRILGGSGSGNASSGLDVSEVITSDGSAPSAGTGFSLDANDPDALVEETYVDDYLHAGVYYTSHGINSSKANGGDELDGVSKIRLSNGGNSYVELYDSGDIKFNIEDNSLGFNLGNIIAVIDFHGNERLEPYAGQTNGEVILNLGSGEMFKLDVDVDFTGFTETRDSDPTEYLFGQTGSGYEDLDLYSVTVLPTVYAYAEGEKVRVLTEGDKDELVNRIEDSMDFVPITQQEILGLF